MLAKESLCSSEQPCAFEEVAAALALLERFADQKLTLADATIASMAARAGARVMTFDTRHFALMGASIVEEADA